MLLFRDLLAWRRGRSQIDHLAPLIYPRHRRALRCPLQNPSPDLDADLPGGRRAPKAFRFISAAGADASKNCRYPEVGGDAADFPRRQLYSVNMLPSGWRTLRVNPVGYL